MFMNMLYVYTFIINVFLCVDLYYIIIIVYMISARPSKRKRVEPPVGCLHVRGTLFIKREAGVGMLPAEVVCGCDRLFGIP